MGLPKMSFFNIEYNNVTRLEKSESVKYICTIYMNTENVQLFGVTSRIHIFSVGGTP